MKKFLPIALVALLLTGCGKQENVPTTETATSGSFELMADEALRPVVDSLVTGFMLENPDAHVTVKYGSAEEAVLALLNHQARAILIDRNLSPKEDSILLADSARTPSTQWVPLEMIPLAWDGIAVIAAQKSPLSAIRKSDLAKLFRGKLSNGSGLYAHDFDGSSTSASTLETITIALPAYPSSIEYSLDSILLGKGMQTTAAHILRFSTSDSVIDFVRKNPDAIGFIGSAWDYTIASDSSVKTLPVMPADSSSVGLTEPVLLNMAYIAQGDYPLVTHVNGYSFEVPNTIPRGFLAFAATAHGQLVFKNYQVLPITQPIKIVRSEP